MTGLRAVVFDLDGTLIDSVPDIAAALNRCLASEKRTALSDQAVAKLVGGGARELVARALQPGTSAADIDRVLADFLAHYEAEPVTRTRPYPGARWLLDDLAHRGLALAICTNKPIRLTRLILDHLGLAPYFTAVWGGDPGRPLKPDAHCLNSVCAALSAEPAETIMVGDSHIDVEAARASGCRSILVGHGYEKRPLTTLGADVVVPGLAEAGLEIARLANDAHSALRQPA